MALFLGTYNVPTNKKLRVNSTDVTEVYSNGVLVWQYKAGVTAGGLPTAGSKGHWVDTGTSVAYQINLSTGARTLMGGSAVVGYGEKVGSCSPFDVDMGGFWISHCPVMRWIPA